MRKVGENVKEMEQVRNAVSILNSMEEGTIIINNDNNPTF